MGLGIFDEEITSEFFDKKTKTLIRTVFQKRKFSDNDIDKYSIEDFKEAFKNLNIDFCEPKISLLEKEDEAFEILKKASKVNFKKENKTELEEYILNRLNVIIDHYKPFKSFDIKSCS